MKTYKKCNSVIFTAVVVLLIMILSCCGVLVNLTYAFAETKQTNIVSNDEISLDSDIINGSDLTIRDYSEFLHATKAAVRSKIHGLGVELCNLTEDDPIVYIINKNRFFEVGQVLEMGDEYGYFIKTTQTEQGNYLSTVLVFDITTNTDLHNTQGQIIVEVSPIFQYKYVGLTNDATFELFHNEKLYYNVLDDLRVVAYPSAISSYEVEYENTEEYYIKDISFGTSLFNAQTLNCGDVGYDPYNDYGSYFTGFDYSYQGKYREYGEFDDGELDSLITDTCMWALGWFEAVPALGNVIAVAGQLYSIVSLGIDWIDYGVDKYNSTIAEFKTIDKKITATCFYQNRDDQLKYNKDKNNNPYLVKNALIAVDTGDEKSIWYGVGDNVTGYFNIGHSALDGRTPNYTCFTNQLALQIVSTDGDTVVAAGDTIIQDYLRETETKELEFLDSGEVYMLSDGQDHFIYKDILYESDYNVQINLSNEATVTVNGESKFGRNLIFNVHAEQHDDIKIDLSENAVGLQGEIHIDLNKSTLINSISANGKYMLKANLVGVKELKTNNSDLIIEEIFINENNEFVPYKSFVPFKAGSSITYPFDSNQEYYIVIRNNSSKDINNIELQVNEIKTFVPETSVVVNDDVQAMSFRNTFNIEMSFQLILSQERGQNTITVFDSSGRSIGYNTVMASGDIKFSFGLQAGDVCYIFFNLSESVMIEVLPDENYIKWEIDGTIYNVDYKISLPRGAEYDVRLLYVKDNNSAVITTSYNIDNRSDYFSFNNNVLTLTYNVPYEYVITIVPILYPDSTLRIIPIEGREDIGYEITFNKEGGSGGTDCVYANYNCKMPSAVKPSRTGYNFGGYYIGQKGTGTQYYDSNMLSVTVWDKEEAVTLYAYWLPIRYTITYRGVEGTSNNNPSSYTVEDTIYLVPPTKTGYTATLDRTVIYKGTTGNLTISVTWTPISYRVLIHHAIYDTWMPADDPAGSASYWFELKYNESKTITAKTLGYRKFKFWVYYPTVVSGTHFDHTTFPIYSYDETITIKNLSKTNGYDYDVVACYDKVESCVAEGTLITLADGTQKAVEKLSGNEQLLVWNLQTGKFDTAPILFIDKDAVNNYKVIKLNFSDGTTVDIISEHAFWDFDLNKYIFLREDAEKYIGHWFNKQIIDDGELAYTKVQLVNVRIEERYTTAWSPVTYGHLCYYVNGLLSMPGATESFINIFSVDDETLSYKQDEFVNDIETYGLFTYDEFYQLIPVSEDVFNAFNGQYLKVAIGKGITNLKILSTLFERYQENLNMI